MGGLILLLAIGIWIYIAVRLSIWLYRRVQTPSLKTLVKWCAFPLILVLPLGDEIVGEIQLRYLCSQGAVLHVDEERARGAELTLRYDPSTLSIPRRRVHWTALPITEGSIELYASGHAHPVIHFKEYGVGHSFFSGVLGSSSPAFAEDGCSVEDYSYYMKVLEPLLAKLNAKIINRKIATNEGDMK
jgi:hypothetical protein